MLAKNQTVNEKVLEKFIKDMRRGKINQKLSHERAASICNDTDTNFFRDKYSYLDKQTIQSLCLTATSCQSSKNFVNLVNSSPDEQLTVPQGIARLCPLILFQLRDRSCATRSSSAKQRPSIGAVWGYAILFVTLISVGSMIGVIMIPFLGKNSYHYVLNLFEGLAVGSLAGSALFHLIPEAFDLEHVIGPDFLYKTLVIFSGIYLFFWIERIMKMIVDMRREKELERAPKAIASVRKSSDQKHVEAGRHHIDKSDFNNSNDLELSTRNETQVNGGNIEAPKHRHNHVHSKQSCTSISTIAWMIIFGDGFHNFIDGLSIGASFTTSIMSGIAISLSVLCEELPHELGDFAVLLGSGMSTRQAVGYNFLSACTCYIGMALGILLGQTEGRTYILAFAGGMFLYISLVDVMSELISGLDDASTKSKSFSLKILFFQNVGILIGITILFCLAKFMPHHH
ncbi:hypothetical protein B4U79_05675 [Dinothrombium tinctorium]|uniref:Zinc transporter ZIP14-like protein n=1 Tax=Dinothrombium tinctorium TaxID=1965070 RepID=A0A3S3QZ21_9ACAR|nr:hypothetical protein B4U79_05675 [Dinothrombium tinctorium]